MNTLRVQGAFTVTDAFLLAAALILLPSILLRRRIEGVNESFLLAGSLLVMGALLGATSSSEYAANLGPLAKLVIAVFLVYAVFVAWEPTIGEAWLFVGCYVASASVSALWGVFHLNPYTDRAAGLTVHPNHLALVCVLALGPALAAALILSGWRAVLAAAAAVVLLTGVVSSGSRAALVGAAVVIGLATVLAARARIARLLLLVALGAVLLIPFLVLAAPTENALARFTAGSESARASDIGRRQLISEAVALVEDHPLTGAGLEAAKQPHDIFLGLLAGGGPIALLGLLLLIAVPVRSLAATSWGRSRDATEALIGGLSFGA
jgi:O-antigen ligase